MHDDSSTAMISQHAAAARVAIVGICMSASVMLGNALLIFGLALLESITEYKLGAISLCLICGLLVVGGCLFAWLCMWGPFHRND